MRTCKIITIYEFYFMHVYNSVVLLVFSLSNSNYQVQV